MFGYFYPSERIKSTYDIDFKALYESGIRGLIFDIDNTLVPHGAPCTKESDALMQSLLDIGFKVMLLSNNKAPRVELFIQNVKLDYISKANKPGKKNYLRAVEMMGLTKEEVVFIGDQLFTDLWGSKKAGIRNILVEPIDSKEEIQIVLKRILERIVLKEYERKNRK